MHYSFSEFGQDAEFIVGTLLKYNNWNVYFSKGSKGPADIIAMKGSITWLIQVKSSRKIPKIKGSEVNKLINLSNKINNSFPVLSLIHPKLKCNINKNSIFLNKYMLNFYLLPYWNSVNLCS